MEGRHERARRSEFSVTIDWDHRSEKLTGIPRDIEYERTSSHLHAKVVVIIRVMHEW